MKGQNRYFLENLGVLAVAQWSLWCLCCARTEVRSLAQHGGLGIWCCHSFSLGQDSGSDLIPGLGTTCAAGPKNEKKKKKSYYNIVDYIPCAIHYIPVIYLFYNWKFVLLYLFCPFRHPRI